MVEAKDPTADKAEPGGLRRIIAIALIILVVTALTLEIGIRIAGSLPEGARSKFEARSLTPDSLRPALEAILEEAVLVGHPFLGYSLRPGYSAEEPQQRSINSFGFRGPEVTKAKPEGVYRIVCLGGSSTYGHTPSSDATTWPARLQYWLNHPEVGVDRPVEVLNAGCSGWSTFESATNLATRMIEFEPDLVIVYHTINDARCALWLRGGEIKSDNSHWRAIWPRWVEAPGERLLENSMSYLVLRNVLTSYAEDVDTLNNYAIVGYDPADKDPFEPGEPDEQGFENFRRNLVNIEAIARAHGADVMFVTQACDDRDLGAPSAPAQIAAMARMTEILGEVAQERDVHLVDAKTDMERKGAEEGWDKYFTQEVHLTDDGCNLLALLIGGPIKKLGLIE